MKIITYSKLNLSYENEFYGTISYDFNSSTADIIEEVKQGGDKKLIEISAKFNDGNFNSSSDFLVNEQEIEDAYNKVDREFLKNLNVAKNNIEYFAKNQLSCIKDLELDTNSSILGHKILPLERVLCYAPGGNYPLPSSCLMTIIPARVAGVKEVYLTSPRIKPETIVAAHLAGANKIYKLGGAQAISAFAYGTESIEQVNKIVGPGNKYVTYAKKHVYGTVDIDFLAGPSEVLIIADDYARPELVAADMLAQCEHDKDARAYLLCNSVSFANKVQDAADKFLSSLKTSDIAKASFDKSFAIVFDNLLDSIDIANKRAPEHLELMVNNEDIFKDKLVNYGSLFVGENCAEVFGDYVSGTNHVLPTNSASKYTGGLSVFDFIKILTYQKISKEYAAVLSNTASFIANAEGLMAHKLASDLRG